ncbi:putative bifunctional diguanylate cyclase/phosphodiesterase [Pilimelia anulata]|nr:bifunctional diguanylate cyclase/phosphodiesterase [Pilimelia anulata]
MMTLTVLISVSRIAYVRLRVGGTHQATSWNCFGILIALATIESHWVVLCVFVSSIVYGAVLRLAALRFLFSIAKEVVLAAAGSAALALTHFSAGDPQSWRLIGSLLCAYVTMELVGDLLVVPVVALASRTPIIQRFTDKLDIRLMLVAAQTVLAIGTVVLVLMTPSLLVAVPGLVLSLHLWSASRLRSRAEREAWQQLATTTEGLNDVDLDAVLTLGVIRAAELFSADEVEIAYRDGETTRLLRGDSRGVHHDGPPETVAPTEARDSIAVPLSGPHDGPEIGELRLRFRGKVTLSERERYTLRTFASALCTALRNAAAYAELERVAAAHAHAAAHDPLTGLTNRRALLDQGAKLLGQRHTHGVMALLLIDLDHFKEVNDTLGHAAGDQVIIAAAQRLRAAAGTGDIVARLGGDEFAVLLTQLPAPAIASNRAAQIVDALHHPVDIEGMQVAMEASGGVAVATGTSGMVELLRRADVAMYQAKRAGDRVAVYSRRRDTSEVGRRTRGGERPGLVADQEFSVLFQPIVDLADGQVVAAEALVRLKDFPTPADDPAGLLEAVDRPSLLPQFQDIVLDLALLAAADWREAGFDLPVSVNIAPRSLLDPRFPAAVITRLRTHDIAPERLILELTESLALTPLDVVQDVLGQLRAAGVKLTLDDVGHGSASLAVLSQLPLYELKIGPEFVRGMASSAEAATVVRSAVELGRSLKVAVVATGVETEAQRRVLWELGCAAGQGHLFARPMAASRLLAALHRGTHGRPGLLASPLHDEGAVIRIPTARRPTGRNPRLPHLPA